MTTWNADRPGRARIPAADTTTRNERSHSGDVDGPEAHARFGLYAFERREDWTPHPGAELALTDERRLGSAVAQKYTLARNLPPSIVLS